MAKRYSKFHSNYILRKKHQESTKGTIWERDWVTIGAQHQLEKGKRVFYGDTNFLFTDNTFNSYKKKHNFSKWVAEWTYDEAVENASPEVNIVTTNWESNDLRDFAYYGSCVELIKNAIFEIVKWFPGRITRGVDALYVGEKYGLAENGYYTKGVKLKNPFGLDLYRNIYDQQTDENIKRYVADSYDQYQINGEDIKGYSVYKVPYDCRVDITKLCEISILSTYGKLYFIDGYDVFGEIVYVEGDSPYTRYYTSVDDDGTFNRVFPFPFSVYTESVYIHKNDVDKVYVLVHDVEEENYEGELETKKSIVVFKQGDEPFFGSSYEIMIGGHRYIRNWKNDKTWQDIKYYCWSVEHGDSQDYDITYKDIYTTTLEPRIGEYVWLWVTGDGVSYDMMNSETVSENFKIDNITIVENTTLSDYTLYDYWKSEDGEEVTITIEEYEALTEEEQNAYTPRYYWTMSPEEFVNFDDDELLGNEYYFTINNLEGDDSGIEPFFGEIGKVSILQERPQNVTDYVDSLHGIEHLLLNNKTSPLYQATLITPVETDGGYLYTEKFYTWPSTDGYIDVSSALYHQYMDRLIEIATIFDETWCDNLWRNMTHEAIRNFDWSYKKDYTEGDEEAFVAGGRRMQDVIHIYGRIADELKRYIQGIKMTTVVTTDGYNNMPSAEVSDKLEYRGWDVYSTIPTFKPSDEVKETIVDNTNIDADDNSSDSETEEVATTTKDIENSYDYSTVKIDNSFMKTYIQKQRRTISHVDYYRLPEESRSKYTFDYIRVGYNSSLYTEDKKYDAYGTDIISPEEYNDLSDFNKNRYTLRYQDTILTKDKYEELSEENKENYEPYQYINKNNLNDILRAAEYNLIRWAEDYTEQSIYDSEGYTASVYCKKKVDEDGKYVVEEIDGEEHFVCDNSSKTFKPDEYATFRRGKDKYEVYTYRKKDDIVAASERGYTEYIWVKKDENGEISNTIENEEEFNQLDSEEKATYEKRGKEDSYRYGESDGYQPYSVIIGEYGVYPVSSFYPYEYERYSTELFNINAETTLSDDNFDDDVVIEQAKEIITMYDYNTVGNWQEDYFVYEYFEPSDVENWIYEANADGLTRYAWETIANMKNEGDDVDIYRPYRLINKEDGDTIITPEQWLDLPLRSEWTVSSYKCSLNDNIIISVEDFNKSIYEYSRLNVIPQSYFETLSATEQLNFAPYEPTEVSGFDRWFNARNYNSETMGEQDIRFVKELMMMSKRMFATKGTRQGIDMIMSMFGFGEDSYTLTEKYHRIDLDKHLYDENKYYQLRSASLYENSGTYFEDDDTFPDNTVPMGTVELHGVRYIIPYYDKSRTYAGDEVYFQSKGGWGYKQKLDRDSTNDMYNYMETMSYLRVVDSIGDLLSVNARSVHKYDIYYVMSLTEVVEYDKNTEVLSHFFYLDDDFNPHLYRSWVNIDINIDTTNSTNTNDMIKMAKKAKYLDSIVSNSIGNNPHTGYGKYDLGDKFVDYMKKPFKYYLDNYVIDADLRKLIDGEDASYELVTTLTDDITGKVKDVTEREKYSTTNIFNQPIEQIDRYVDDYDLKHKTDDDYALSGRQYYINDKTLIMTNKINNNLYKKYFFDVIVHYLMQMIPSTTILVLENFDIDNGDS